MGRSGDEHSRRSVLVALAGLGAALPLLGCREEGSPTPVAPPEGPTWRPKARLALKRGARWLWSRQGSDGLWRSETYGLFASGQSLSPFVLLGLLQLPEDLAPLPAEAAMSALRAMRGLTRDGALGLAVAAPDYPCYATGLMLSCVGGLKPQGWREVVAPSIQWLRTQQFRAANGWEGHPAQGGWGMGSLERRAPPDAGHVDISMTRRVIEGLRTAGLPGDDPALIEAVTFLDRCQVADGGFIYSPVQPSLNKGRKVGDPPASQGYGTATCDGILSHLVLGQGGSDQRVTKALARLQSIHRLDRNPGLEGGPMEVFGPAMVGSYRAGSATVFALLDPKGGWRDALVDAVLAEQREDGSWRNESPLQKEDDPLVATGFAVRALHAVLL